MGLGYAIRDGVLLITTGTKLAEMLDIELYDVSDLVLRETEDGRITSDFAGLINVLTDTIDPDTWREVGGQGTVSSFKCSFQGQGIHVLIISQTQQVHNKIAALLQELRSHRRELPKARELKSGDTSQPATPTDSEPPRAVPPAPHGGLDAATANNQFACDLYRRLRTDKADNLLFSPASLSTALSMVADGARGETADELWQALRLPSETHRFLAQLRLFGDQPKVPRGVELKIANRLWGQAGYPFHDSFLKVTREQHGAELGRLDFSQTADAARHINGWIESQTAGRIRHLVNPADFNALTRFVLTNAVYFNGKWEKPFEASNTRLGDFHTDQGKTPVPMMNLQDECRFAVIDDMQILEKDYAGSDCSMMILLPNKKGVEALTEVENRLSADKLAKWSSRLTRRTVIVYIPRFQFDSTMQLKKALADLGVERAFSPRDADFSGISSEPGLYLETAIHKALVNVNEEGTEAAAATGFGGFGGPGPSLPEFRANRPFVFLIRDRKTGVILFLGRLVKPGPEVPARPAS
ncbi:MAG: serpin family protein [Planctomycetaceae bacterium]